MEKSNQNKKMEKKIRYKNICGKEARIMGM
jgi:hypothetical protein